MVILFTIKKTYLLFTLYCVIFELMDNNTTKMLQTLTRQINAIISNLIYYDWYYFIIDNKIIYAIFINVFYIVLYIISNMLFI